MERENEQQLRKLQAEKENLISKRENEKIDILKKRYKEKIIQVQNEMAKLNKLNDEEKNIHAIWIGIPSEDEFDNLKVWTKYNPSYKIHIWTDSTHILTHKLNNAIFDYSIILKNGVQEHDYQFEANLKDDFYNNYQLKNLTKTFDENAKEFLLHLQYATETTINSWVKEGKKQLIQEQKKLKKYTPNQVILHDVNEEKNNIFPNKEYYNGYLKTLEHLHLCAGASDRLRYAILNKFGGVYLDTDVAVRFNLEKIEDEKMTKLIDSIKCQELHNGRKILKSDVVLNQIILLEQTNQLNEKSLKKFAQKWEKVFEGIAEKDYPILKKIAKRFNRMNLKLKPNMLLNEFPINNFYPTTCHYYSAGISNAFIVSKENSKILQDAMENIEILDKNIKNMDTFKKLINKDMMTLYHTGPGNLLEAILQNDKNYFYIEGTNSDEILDLETINDYNSSWIGLSKHKDTITNKREIKSLFLLTKTTNEEKNTETKVEAKHERKRSEKTKKLTSKSKNYESDFELEL